MAQQSQWSGPQQAEAVRRLIDERLVRSGANAFFFIAALSLVNSVFSLARGSWHFLIGLGITQVIDGISENADSGSATIMAFMINITVSGLFVLFGVFGRKEQKWAFFAGITLYALDSLIFVVLPPLAHESPDLLSFGLHVFFLVFLGLGLRSLLRLSQSPAQVQVTAASTCPRCGNHLAPQASFCSGCGDRVREDSQVKAESWPPPYRYPAAPDPAKPEKKHSRLGIASLCVSVVAVLGLLCFLVVAATAGVFEPGGVTAGSTADTALGVLFAASALAALVALVLGLAALLQKNRALTLPILGAAFGGVTLLAYVVVLSVSPS